MMSSSSRILLVAARLGACAVVAALVIVPTIMRSRQHIELRDSTRLSIRLNWQSDIRPYRSLVTRADATTSSAATPALLVWQPDVVWVTLRVHACADPLVVRPPFDNAPDLFRGPPAPRV